MTPTEQTALNKRLLECTTAKGFIIQIVTHENPIWIASLFIVDEVKTWGCQAYCPSPGKGNIWMRFKWEEFVIVGEAVMLMDRGEDEQEEERPI